MAAQQDYYTTRYTDQSDLNDIFDPALNAQSSSQASTSSATVVVTQPDLYFDPFKRRSTLAGYTRSRQKQAWKEWDAAHKQDEPDKDYYRWYEPDRDPELEARYLAAHGLLEARRFAERDSPPPPEVQQDGWFGWQIPPQIKHRVFKKPARATTAREFHVEQSIPARVDGSDDAIEPDDPLLVTGASAYPGLEWQEPDLHAHEEDEDPRNYTVRMAGAWLEQKYRDIAPAYQEGVYPWHIARTKAMNNWSIKPHVQTQEIFSGRECSHTGEDDSSQVYIVVNLAKNKETLVSAQDLDAGWEAGCLRPQTPQNAMFPSSTSMLRTGRISSWDTLDSSRSSNNSVRARQWEGFHAYDSDFPSLQTLANHDSSEATSPRSRSASSSVPRSASSPRVRSDEWSFSDLPPTSPSTSPNRQRIANYSPSAPPTMPNTAPAPPRPNAAIDARQQQSSMLRQYSSIYVERARDPWLMHDSPEFRRQMIAASQGRPIMPSWFSEDSEALVQQAGNLPASSSELPAPSRGHSGDVDEDAVLQEFDEVLAQDEESEIDGPWCEICDKAFYTEEAYDHHPCHLSINDNERRPSPLVRPDQGELSPCQSIRSDSPELPPLIRSHSPRSMYQTERARPKPLADSTYCPKCRRHFQSSFRLRNHLMGSNFHPYYCQYCTVDFRSFGDLHMHYATDRYCRPPEMETAWGKGFLQILVEYQETCKKKLRLSKFPFQQDPQPSPSQSNHTPAIIPLPTRRWWHPPPPSPERVRSPVQDLVVPSAIETEVTAPSTHPTNASTSIKGKGKLAILPIPTPARSRPLRRPHNPDLEPPSCPICINPLMEAQEVVATACGHVYCAKCLLQNFSRCNNSCPKCRTPLSMSMIIPIYIKND